MLIFVPEKIGHYFWRRVYIYIIYIIYIYIYINIYIYTYIYNIKITEGQATGLDAWASRVKCPARFVSHLHEICIYIYELFIALFVLLFVHFCHVMVYVVYCVASGNQEKVQACLVTLWLFIISCHSLYKTTLGSLCSWKPAWSLKKHPHSMCLKPFVKMCIFVVIQIFWLLRKYREQ